jgi:hypothetical protein
MNTNLRNENAAADNNPKKNRYQKEAVGLESGSAAPLTRWIGGRGRVLRMRESFFRLLLELVKVIIQVATWVVVAITVSLFVIIFGRIEIKASLVIQRLLMFVTVSGDGRETGRGPCMKSVL